MEGSRVSSYRYLRWALGLAREVGKLREFREIYRRYRTEGDCLGARDPQTSTWWALDVLGLI
jgi:hypothetical protein